MDCKISDLVAPAKVTETVEVVRCKHCKNWEPFNGEHFCEVMELWPGPNFFCPYGEPKDAEQVSLWDLLHDKEEAEEDE